MSELLPRETPINSDAQEPEVVGLQETNSGAVFSVLSSGMARSILSALYESPATQSDLAETVDTSIQNVSHHIENMIDADLVTVVDQWYSEKGKDMDVYAPRNGPLVVVGGDAAQTKQTRNVVGALELTPATPARGD